MAVAAPELIARAEQDVPGKRGAGIGQIGLLGYGCGAIILLATLCAVFGSLLSPGSPNALNLARAYVGPSSGHLLGFDSQGRDLLSRLITGARTAMLGPLAVVALSITAGTVLAMAAAWRGGWLDACISAVVDILFAFPGILLAVLAAAVFGASLTAATLSLAVAYSPYIARIIRAAAIRERSQPYVAALEVQGLSAVAICRRHLIPNVLPLLIAEATILFGWAMLDLAAISFLGLGVQPPQADWGVMVSAGETGVLQGYPTEAIAAGAAIVIVVVAFNLLGERLNDRHLQGTR